MNAENQPQAGHRCPQCGAELPPHVPAASCPKCLLKAAMATSPCVPLGESGLATTSTAGAHRGLPEPGAQLGHYSIMRLLGSGGMGAVFEAQDLESGRRVALKVLSQSLEAPDARQRFLREGRLAASLNHPNSVYVFGTEEIAGTPVISMEMVAGGTLDERVRAHGPLPPAEAVDAILQIITGLQAAQRVGILHRDVKPSNCFLAPDGTVKIGDFGLSISTSVRLEPALTTSGTFLGTPAFSSPEQLRGADLSARSDMYSVGATLYYLLTGHTPFEAKNTVQLLATVLEQRPKSPTKLRAGIPNSLARIVLRCLEKDEAQRYRDYDELLRVLAPYSSAAPSPATLGLRLVAALFDGLLLAGLGNLFFFLCFGSPLEILRITAQPSAKGVIALGIWAVGALLYYALPEGLWGATAGKALVRLRVTRLDRTAPGIGRALLRAFICLIVPISPYWICVAIWGIQFGFSSTQATSLLFYIILAGLFSTARKHNGFAAVHDLITGTRVVSRGTLVARPVLVQETAPPASVDSQPTLGPYHILDTLQQTTECTWLLGFDLRLLRRVWVRQVSAGTPPVRGEVRNVGRVGRLRWLNGRRSEVENWDAFEALTGQPLLRVIERRQSWKQVRFWLDDVARELNAAQKDGSMPLTLALDRIWVTSEGQAKLLDFPVPGAHSQADDGVDSPEPTRFPLSAPDPLAFIRQIAAVALSGSVASPDRVPALPLPMHARHFLDSLSQMRDLDAAQTALKPLLSRFAEVTRLRRAALVAGCTAIPLLAVGAMLLGTTMIRNWNETQPGLMDLNNLLHQRSAMRFWGGRMQQIDDRQVGVYIAAHYAGVVTNQGIWNGPIAFAMIQGSARQFAQECVTKYANASPQEVKAAEEALKGFTPSIDILNLQKNPWMPMVVFASSLLLYVGLPALLGALLFRGGLVLLTAGVTFVNAAGAPASRLRLLWRALVTWSCMAVGLGVFLALTWTLGTLWAGVVGLVALAVQAGVSLALPERGIQDRLAGTWPVPR
jgi:eukaryotic-like serine/threonine-protein kinase